MSIQQHNPGTVGFIPGADTLAGGDLLQIATGRFREAGESTAITIPQGAHSGNYETPSADECAARSERVVDRSNRADLRDMHAVPIYSTTGHMLVAKDAPSVGSNQWACTADRPRRRAWASPLVR